MCWSWIVLSSCAKEFVDLEYRAEAAGAAAALRMRDKKYDRVAKVSNWHTTTKGTVNFGSTV